ncbi:hypothetical protein ASD15_11335 [Massilia sp. Root351]|uniref:hypothetical protein n=1 Tax=Massilia sp. Root351 TaxID=1736522 RepID=UPI000709A026|nr:hypothetical protein [Massilia sp. Root351]KQV82579.1 hypothetical protein ASD15_11335 [Massilia sp. Root351]
MTSISTLSNWQPLTPRLPAAGAPKAAATENKWPAPSAIVNLSPASMAAAKQSEAEEAALPPSTAARFKGLGAAMLSHFRTGAAVPVEQAKLPEAVDNKFTLSITTRSGVKVDLSLASLDDGMALQVSASAELNEDERNALSSLAAGFQNAIDGMAINEPQVRLGALAQFDSKFLQSVEFHAAVKQYTEPPSTQTLDFVADGKQRKVSIGGASGSAEVSVDTSKIESLGTKEQQAKAIASYLKQFDQAAARGRGDAGLMTMFKDAFSDMSRTATREAPRDNGLSLPDKWTLAPEDHAVLTGLADFSASVTQSPKWPNPLRLSEKDSFAYEVSQNTRTEGARRDDRAISQTQQARLTAQFHEPPKKGGVLNLDVTPQSQNYTYHLIDDSASSKVELGYKEGKLFKATLQQSASQSEQVLKYVMGKQTSNQTIPSDYSVERDLMASLAPYQPGKSDRSDEQTGAAKVERRAQSLSALRDTVFLLGTPSELAARAAEYRPLDSGH